MLSERSIFPATRCIAGAVALLALTTVSHEVGAQRAVVELERGDRVRVTAPTLNVNKQTLLFVQRRDDVIHLQSERRLDDLSIPVAQIARLDVVRGTRRPWVAHGFVGLLAGAGVGWLISQRVTGSCTSKEMFGCIGTDLVGGLVFLGVTTGGLITGITHGLKPRDRWVRVMP